METATKFYLFSRNIVLQYKYLLELQRTNIKDIDDDSLLAFSFSLLCKNKNKGVLNLSYFIILFCKSIIIHRYSILFNITMTPTVALLRSACLLVWMAFLPSNMGFQLTTNSPCQRCRQHSAHGMVTRHQSPFLSTNHRLVRGFQLEGIFGSREPSSSSSSDDDSTDDSTDDAEIVAEETEKTLQYEDAEIVAEETEKKNQDEDADDTDTDTSSSSAKASSDDDVVMKSPSSEKSLLTSLSEIGDNFQALAQKATAKGYQCEDKVKKILYAAKACLYYTFFIIYRAYRGFFVLLPATFRQVYVKMEAAMNTGNLSLEEIGFSESGEDSIRSKSTTKWRTKFTVSLLASVVTISYVFGGILKMASKFIRTIVTTSNVPKSFEAAADEVVDFEGRIGRVGKVNKVNGEEDIEPTPYSSL